MFDPCFHRDQFLEQQGFFVESFAAVVSQHDDFSDAVHFLPDVPAEGLFSTFTTTIVNANNNTIIEMYFIHFGLRFGGQHSPFSQPQSLFTVFVGSIDFCYFRSCGFIMHRQGPLRGMYFPALMGIPSFSQSEIPPARLATSI